MPVLVAGRSDGAMRKAKFVHDVPTIGRARTTVIVASLEEWAALPESLSPRWAVREVDGVVIASRVAVVVLSISPSNSEINVLSN